MGPKTKTRPQKSPRKTEICKNQTDKVIADRLFEPYSKPTIGCRFLRFSERGQKVVGRLGYPIKNFRQGTSYPLELDNGEVVEFVGNKLSHNQIREGELCGRRIEIVYQGRQIIFGGHYRKIFRIYRLEDEPGFSKEQWNKILNAAKKKRKR